MLQAPQPMQRPSVGRALKLHGQPQSQLQAVKYSASKLHCVIALPPLSPASVQATIDSPWHRGTVYGITYCRNHQFHPLPLARELQPNARAEPRPMAGATQERKLWSVGFRVVLDEA